MGSRCVSVSLLTFLVSLKRLENFLQELCVRIAFLHTFIPQSPVRWTNTETKYLPANYNTNVVKVPGVRASAKGELRVISIAKIILQVFFCFYTSLLSFCRPDSSYGMNACLASRKIFSHPAVDDRNKLCHSWSIYGTCRGDKLG